MKTILQLYTGSYVWGGGVIKSYRIHVGQCWVNCRAILIYRSFHDITIQTENHQCHNGDILLMWTM